MYPNVGSYTKRSITPLVLPNTARSFPIGYLMCYVGLRKTKRQMIVPKRYDEEHCALVWLWLEWKDKLKNKKKEKKK